jgi:GrpB-like predicted nucleotidyltransferase (UPF0157 family)
LGQWSPSNTSEAHPVPGLAGKPTIDIAVGIASLELAEGAKERMERLGYSYGGDLAREAERYAALKTSLVAERGDWYHGRDEEAFIRPVLDARPT